MLSSVYMTPIEAVPLTTKSSLPPSSTKIIQVVAPPRLVQVATVMISLRDSEPSLHPEVLEASLVLENNSESWTTTTPDLSISTSSPKP